MSRKRLAALGLLAVVITSATVGYLLFLPPYTPEPPEEVNIIEPHPYNRLNWWEVAWDLGVSEDYLTPLSSIVGYGNRYNENPESGYYLAADQLMESLDRLGISSHLVKPHDAVLAHQRGYGTDNRAIVFGAHLDSDPAGQGVNQNAGGAAVVMMIATILSNFRLPIDVYYSFFSYNTVFLDGLGRVRALFGAAEIADELVENYVNIIAVYNFDEVLFTDPDQPSERRLIAEHERDEIFGYHKTKYLADLLVTMMQQSGLNIMSAREERRTQSDHWKFWDRGLPAINVVSGHAMNPESPPVDSTSSASYNTTQARLLAKAAAAVAVYLGTKGNGAGTSYKIQESLGPGASVSISTVMTMSQTLAIHGTLGQNATIRINILDESGLLLTTIAANMTDISLSSDREASLGAVTLTITNMGDSTADFDLYLDYESDTDGNGVLDSVQLSWPEPDPPLDWDSDGLSDSGELEANTDKFLPDTDMDGISDGLEVLFETDPLRDDILEDLDGDGLTNLREFELGTFPNSADTDQDSMDDLWEIVFLTDPLVDDSLLDPDHDNLTNLEEYTYGADPLSQDGDFDGVKDAEEVALGMNPLSDDSDSDGLRDRLEIIEGLDPLTPDYDLDLAPDGPDHNPRINTLIVIALITVVPVAIGTIFFWRRIR